MPSHTVRYRGRECDCDDAADRGEVVAERYWREYRRNDFVGNWQTLNNLADEAADLRDILYACGAKYYEKGISVWKRYKAVGRELNDVARQQDSKQGRS